MNDSSKCASKLFLLKLAIGKFVCGWLKIKYATSLYSCHACSKTARRSKSDENGWWRDYCLPLFLLPEPPTKMSGNKYDNSGWSPDMRDLLPIQLLRNTALWNSLTSLTSSQHPTVPLPLWSHASRANCPQGPALLKRKILIRRRSRQWRHLGGGARGVCRPPRIVKCKSFALSVSSKGSLYISHNGR